ncbi:MAG: universal stress protein [Chloroflexota bacterium]
MTAEPSFPSYKKVLVAFDGSEGSARALRRGLFIARSSGCGVTALFVDEGVPQFAKGFGEAEELDSVREAKLAELRRQVEAEVQAHGGTATLVGQTGHPAQVVVGYAKENDCDLVVMGHTGQSGIWGTLMGSTTSRVADHAPCDVLVVR